MSPLAHAWEHKLAAEGLAPLRPKCERGVRNGRLVSLEQWTRAHSSATSDYWINFTHVVHALPVDYRDRAFLVLYTETGNLREAARGVHVDHETGRRAIKRLARYLLGIAAQQLTKRKAIQ